jgi:hypothetical protein
MANAQCVIAAKTANVPKTKMAKWLIAVKIAKAQPQIAARNLNKIHVNFYWCSH